MMPTRSHTALVCLLLFCLLGLAASATAQVPTTINYQGRLLENTADQDAATGTVDIVFSIWTEPTGGSQLWSESWTGVPLLNGIFSVHLGSNGSPLDPADFQGDSSLYLQLEVGGEILDPRQALGSTPFAIVDEPANEIQDLELSGNELTLSQDPTPTSIDLAPYLDDTDEQDLSISGNDLSLSGDPTSSVDLSTYLDNTDVQTLDLSGDTLTISGSGSSVDLASTTEVSGLSGRVSTLEAALTRTVFVTSTTVAGASIGGLTGADAICQARADAAGLDGVFLAWLSDSTESPSTRFDRLGTFHLADGSPIADDWADLTDGTIDTAIDVDEMGAAAAASSYWTGTAADGSATSVLCDDWTGGGSGTFGSPTASGTTWSAGGSQNCASDVAALLCMEQVGLGIADQELALVGDTLTLTSADGTDAVDLSPYLDDTTVDNQVLSISGNTLSLTSDDGIDQVDLSSYLDNTDDQVLSLSGNTLTLTSADGTDSIDLFPYLDNQVLSLSGNTLSLTSADGTDTVSLASFLDNTDNQVMTLSGNNLQLTSEDGTDTVSLSGYLDNTDSQDITSVLTNGNNANDNDITNLDEVDINSLTIDQRFTCDASSADCITSANIEQDTIGGNDITDNIFILHVECRGECTDISMDESCDVIEELLGVGVEVELIGVACIHNIPSTSANGFVDCDDGSGVIGNNECVALSLGFLANVPCIDGDGSDAIVTCLATDIAR